MVSLHSLTGAALAAVGRGSYSLALSTSRQVLLLLTLWWQQHVPNFDLDSEATCKSSSVLLLPSKVQINDKGPALKLSCPLVGILLSAQSQRFGRGRMPGSSQIQRVSWGLGVFLF